MKYKNETHLTKFLSVTVFLLHSETQFKKIKNLPSPSNFGENVLERYSLKKKKEDCYKNEKPTPMNNGFWNSKN